MNVAMDEAKKSMGRAISSGRAKRRSGMTDMTFLYSRLLFNTGVLISVSTQPGATQFTKMQCRASSVESPLTKLSRPPLLAP